MCNKPVCVAQFLINFYNQHLHIFCARSVDVAFFRPMKQRWAVYAKGWCNKHPTQTINKANFNKIFIPFLLNHFKHARPNVRNGFKVTGLVPFGPDGCDFSKILVKKRKALACPTERVHIDKKIKSDTQVETGLMSDKKY